MFGFFVPSDLCMLAGLALQDAAINNAECGAAGAKQTFCLDLPCQCILSLACRHVLFYLNTCLSSQSSDDLLLFLYKKG